MTILSNSVANGAELNQKCAQIARMYQEAFAAARPDGANYQVESGDWSDPAQFDCLTRETRITVAGKVGRIKILPANPRTARGFSGDLILDEFAFHEDSTAIWEAAEPILSANPDYLCRVASTPNGRHNMFYRLITDPAIPKRIVPRSAAWCQGMHIYHPVTREPITPDQARAFALDKRAYDQNYECIFESETWHCSPTSSSPPPKIPQSASSATTNGRMKQSPSSKVGRPSRRAFPSPHPMGRGTG